MARCPRCRRHFATLDDEADGQHACPRCGFDGHEEPEKHPHAPQIEQLESWARDLEAALLVPGDLGTRALRLIARQTADAMREVATDLAREEA